MDCRARRLERYTEALIDYQIANTNFNEAVFNASQNGVNDCSFNEEMVRALIIKHAYFIECAQRFLGQEIFQGFP